MRFETCLLLGKIDAHQGFAGFSGEEPTGSKLKTQITFTL